MKTKRRVALISLTLLAVAVVYVAVNVLATAFGWAVAYADTGAPTSDGVTSLLAKHGWWGGALLAYGAVSWLLKRNASAGWIAQGRTLALVTAALSVIGPIIGWRLGLDPDAIVYALGGAVPLVVSPTITSSRTE